MLPDSVREVFAQRLAQLSSVVAIDYFQSTRSVADSGQRLTECHDCGATLDLLSEVDALSPNVALRVHELAEELPRAAEVGVDRVPGVVIEGRSGQRLRIFGLPQRHLLPLLLEAILMVAQEPAPSDPSVTRVLQKMRSPLQIRVVGSALHPPAAQATLAAFALASEFDGVEASAFVMESFPELVRDLAMTQTPMTFVNDRGFAGVTTPAGLAQFALDCQNAGEAAGPPTIERNSVVAVVRQDARGGAEPSQVGAPDGDAEGGPTAALLERRPQVEGSMPIDETDRVDVAIIGVGPAGLQTALVLARAQKAIVVFDDPAPPRNAASHGIHGFLGIEGMSPSELQGVAWHQIETYGSARLRRARVVEVSRTGGGDFVVTTEEGTQLMARHVVLALGHRDALPAIPGFAECWGTSVIPCAMCDGYEHRGRAWGIVSTGESAAMDPLMALHWTKDIQLILNADAQLPLGVRERLEGLKIPVHPGRVAAITRDDSQIRGVTLDSGVELTVETLLWMPRHESDALVLGLVDSLGLTLNAAGDVVTDARQLTNIQRLWAVGDVRGWAGALGAAGDGMTAAESILRGWYD